MKSLRVLGLLSACFAIAVAQGAAARAAANPDEKAATSQGKDGQRTENRVPVAIYEFRSSVTEIPARGATDMFIDALVHNGQFRVVERSQLNQSLLIEKQLASQGMSAPEDNKPLRAARYLFEGTISEANASQDQHSGAFSIAGMSIGRGKNKDQPVIALSHTSAAKVKLRLLPGLSFRISDE